MHTKGILKLVLYVNYSYYAGKTAHYEFAPAIAFQHSFVKKKESEKSASTIRGNCYDVEEKKKKSSNRTLHCSFGYTFKLGPLNISQFRMPVAITERLPSSKLKPFLLNFPFRIEGGRALVWRRYDKTVITLLPGVFYISNFSHIYFIPGDRLFNTQVSVDRKE